MNFIKCLKIVKNNTLFGLFVVNPNKVNIQRRNDETLRLLEKAEREGYTLRVNNKFPSQFFMRRYENIAEVMVGSRITSWIGMETSRANLTVADLIIAIRKFLQQ